MPEDNAEQQKPVGPFEDHEACVQHFEGDPEVDDPDSLCQWMGENQGKTAVQEYQPDEGEVEELVTAMKDPATSSVLTDLEVSFVSGVEDPAQDSQWVMAKDTQERGADWGVTAPLVLQKGTAIALDDEQEGEQQKAWAPVLIPNETDKQGDVIPPEAIEQAAHKFVSEFRNIDTDHDLLEGKGTPIESWTLKDSSTFTLPDGSESREYQKGTWMMGVEFSDESWDRIKSGELTGFSIYGEATEHSVADLLGDGVDLEMDAAASAMQATAKEADSGEDQSMENETDSGEQGTTAEKALPEEAVQMFSGSVDAYLAAEDAEPDGVALDEFIQWALDNGEFETDSVIVGGVEFTAEGGGGSEDSDGGGEEQPEETPDEQAEPEEQQMDENENPEDSPDEGESSTKELLEDVRDTVKSTQESVEQHGNRISELEDAVFEKDEGEGEASEAEQEAPEAPDTEQVEQTATEAAESEVKALLGIEELPDDPDERQEVVRKHLHEQPQEGNGVGDPDSWSEDEVSEVVR